MYLKIIPTWKQLVANMFETMYNADGVGACCSSGGACLSVWWL